MQVLPFLLLFMTLALPCTALGADETSTGDDAPTEGEPATPEPASATNTTDNIDNTDTTTEAAATETVAIPRVTADPGSRRITEVLTHLGLYQADQQVIKLGDDDASLSGLYLPENTGNPQGGVLILHDIEQNALLAQTVGPLREYLPDYGWNTLSLFFGNYLPRPLPALVKKIAEQAPAAVISDAAEADTSAPMAQAELAELPTEAEAGTEPVDQNFADEASDTLGELAATIGELPPLAATNQPPPTDDAAPSAEEAFLEGMQLRVDDGLRQLNTLGQFNLVIVAYGLSANWAAASLLERFAGRPGVRGYALVLINARASQYPAVDLNASLAQLQIPMLDLVSGQSKVAQREHRERRNAITRQQNRRYIQIQLPAVSARLGDKSNLITRRVRGWLKSNAAGEEIGVGGR